MEERGITKGEPQLVMRPWMEGLARRWATARPWMGGPALFPRPFHSGMPNSPGLPSYINVGTRQLLHSVNTKSMVSVIICCFRLF